MTANIQDLLLDVWMLRQRPFISMRIKPPTTKRKDFEHLMRMLPSLAHGVCCHQTHEASFGKQNLGYLRVSKLGNMEIGSLHLGS